jgi:hypothetical protein
MKLKKNIKFKDGNQVFRILVSPNDKLVIETRDTESKEAYYHALNLANGKKLFRGFQLDEKFWLGIEKIVNDIIIFHKYAKPDMPGHNGIIAVSITDKKMLWQNDNAEFIAADKDRIYSSRKSFGLTEFIALNLYSGEELEVLGRDEEIAHKLKADADAAEDYSDYIFPDKYGADTVDSEVESIILTYTGDLEIIGDIEYTSYDNLLIANFHALQSSESLTNRLIAFDLLSKKELLNIVLNTNAVMFVPDSFFIYKNSLILIKEKKEVFVYKIVK